MEHEEIDGRAKAVDRHGDDSPSAAPVTVKTPLVQQEQIRLNDPIRPPAACFVPVILAVMLAVLAGCQLPYLSRPAAVGVQVELPPRVAGSNTTRLAVIGDFGVNTQAEADVAARVASWQPDAVITVGDNNYPDGTASTIDDNIGRYYHSFIDPYKGSHGTGATDNRFFPVLGNHDWRTASGTPPLPTPYLDYFELPGNERYYDVTVGSVHIFAIDSDPHEPDGIESTSVQADWLKAALAGSTAPWRLVFMHHPPYSSSSTHGSTPELQWPYAEWGANAVLAGHDHTYERIERNGILYFVNGIGGAPLYPMGAPITGSQVRYNADYGAMLIEATSDRITYWAINRNGVEIDKIEQRIEDVQRPSLPTVGRVEQRVTGSENDAEEIVATGAVNLTSTDLEFITDPNRGAQIVGMRFPGIWLAQGADVRRAYVELTVDEVTGETSSLTFAAEARAETVPFQATPNNLSARPMTTARSVWRSVPAWSVVEQRIRSPDLAPLIREVLNRSDWQPGNALVLLVYGSGRRTAESFDGSPALAPVLRMEVVYGQWLFLPAILYPQE